MSEEIWTALATAVGLLLVLEGLLYAVAPGMMQRIIQMALRLPPSALRQAGTAVLAVGVFLVWLAHG